MDDPFILPDSVDYRKMRFLVYSCGCEVEPLSQVPIIGYYRIIDYRGSPVAADDGGRVHIGHADIPVGSDAEEMVPIDDNGLVDIDIITDIDVDPGDVDLIDDDGMRASPVTVAVIGFMRGQGDPAHMGAMMDPDTLPGYQKKPTLSRGRPLLTTATGGAQHQRWFR